MPRRWGIRAPIVWGAALTFARGLFVHSHTILIIATVILAEGTLRVSVALLLLEHVRKRECRAALQRAAAARVHRHEPRVTLPTYASGRVVVGRKDERPRRVVRLSERRRRSIRTAHCGRCRRRVPVHRPWRGWRHVRVLWFGALIASLPLLPAFAFAASVMLPAFIFFLTAIGPLNELARSRPSCACCGLALGAGVPSAGVATVIALRSRRSHRGSLL